VLSLCRDILSKYPGQDYTKFPQGERDDLIARVLREFGAEQWDFRQATIAIKEVTGKANEAYRRSHKKKVSGKLEK
jgi:hypothetical protein